MMEKELGRCYVENDFMSPKVKYGQKILEYIDKEIVEVRGDISNAKAKLEKLQDRQQVLYNERKNLLNSLCDEEIKFMAEAAPIDVLISDDFKKLLNNVIDKEES